MAVYCLPPNPFRPIARTANEVLAAQIVELIRTCEPDRQWALALHLVTAALDSVGRQAPVRR